MTSNDHTPDTPAGPRKVWPQRHKAITALAAAVVALAGIAAGLLLTAGPGTITAHGSAEDCTGTEQAGQPVTVLDSSQDVIGTGTLADDNSKAAQALELQSAKLNAALGAFGSGNPGMTLFRFTAQVPAGLPRYGIQAGSGHGTVWFSARQMQAGPGLNLGC